MLALQGAAGECHGHCQEFTSNSASEIDQDQHSVLLSYIRVYRNNVRESSSNIYEGKI